MKILWLKSELLHPVDKGGKIRTYQMLKHLKRANEVTYLALTTRADAAESFERASEYSHKLVTVDWQERQKFSARFYFDLATNLVSPLPYALEKYRSTAMRRAIERELSENHYDVVVCDFLVPSVNFEPGAGVASVLFQHNVESTIWQRHYETETNPIKKTFFRNQWRKMLAYERAACRSFDAVVAVSEVDRDFMRDEFGVSAVYDVPTGVDTDYFRPNHEVQRERNNIVFAGSMDWLPNQDGIRFFTEQVMPRINRSIPEATLTVVGRNPHASLIEMSKRDPRIVVTGRVDDVRPYVDRASAYIVPLRIGGGTRLKIYEAMAMEKPIVSTTIGAEGLPVRDGRDLLIADAPEDFADAVIRVLNDREFATSLGSRASTLVRERFGWEKAAESFAAICQQTCAFHAESRNAAKSAKDFLPPSRFFATLRETLLSLCLVVCVYAALAVGVSLTKAPEIDEGWFASPALNLVTTGSMGTTVLEPSGTLTSKLEGINQHTYWVMPLHLLAQAAWYEVLGFSLFSMRLLSIAWGLVALASWFLIMKSLSGNLKLAALAFAFIAFDFIFIMHASLGRMDMMCAALGFAALAAYLCMRERNFMLAVLASQSLVAASLFTHPNGVMAGAGLLFLTLYYDRAQVRWRHALIAATPYLIGAAGWGLYILQSPASFAGQFSDQAAGRAPGLSAPLTALKEEFTKKYFEVFGLAPYSMGASRLKILILVAYAVAIVGAVSVRAIRKHEGFRALLILTAIYFVIETFFNHKLVFYLIHIIPMFAAILAVWVHWCWSERRAPRYIIVMAVCAFLLLQVSGVLYRIRQNAYENDYLPAVAFLKQRAGEKSLVIGSAEMAFGVGFERVIDDIRFGYYSGKTPDFIVMGYHYGGLMKALEEREPAVYEAATESLSHSYKQVYNHGSYQIYALDKNAVARLEVEK